VKLRVTQVFTGCVVIPIVPGLALGKKQADRQTFQVLKKLGRSAGQRSDVF